MGPAVLIGVATASYLAALELSDYFRSRNLRKFMAEMEADPELKAQIREFYQSGCCIDPIISGNLGPFDYVNGPFMMFAERDLERFLED